MVQFKLSGDRGVKQMSCRVTVWFRSSAHTVRVSI